MSIYQDLPLSITFYTQCRFLYTLEHLCFSNLAFKNSWFSKRYHGRLAVGSEVRLYWFFFFPFLLWSGAKYVMESLIETHL